MKKTICFLSIVALLAGCASFEQKRALSKPMVSLAMSKIQENNVQGALVELRKAKDANPGDPEVYMGYAQVYRQTGDYDKAQACVEQARPIVARLGIATDHFQLEVGASARTGGGCGRVTAIVAHGNP